MEIGLIGQRLFKGYISNCGKYLAHKLKILLKMIKKRPFAGLPDCNILHPDMTNMASVRG